MVVTSNNRLLVIYHRVYLKEAREERLAVFNRRLRYLGECSDVAHPAHRKTVFKKTAF